MCAVVLLSGFVKWLRPELAKDQAKPEWSSRLRNSILASEIYFQGKRIKRTSALYSEQVYKRAKIDHFLRDTRTAQRFVLPQMTV